MMYRIPWSALCSVVLFAATVAGCDSEPLPEDPDMGDIPLDMGSSPDASQVEQGDEDEEMSCVPNTVCSEGVCGMQPDGCGGELDCGAPRTCEELGDACGVQPDGCGESLDCGPCACSQGNPLEPTCGACGLGVPSCEGIVGNSAQLASCALPSGQLGEVLAQASQGEEAGCSLAFFYVAPDGVDAPGAGPTNPAKTYGWAKEQAERALLEDDVTSAAVLVAPGLYDEELVVADGVHVFGGFAPTASAPAIWRKRPGLRSEFKPSEPRDTGDGFGLVAERIKTHTVVSDVFVTAPDARAVGFEGRSSYAAFVLGSPGLVLERVRGVGGKGSDGQDGEMGALGADGLNGKALACSFDSGSSGSGFPGSEKAEDSAHLGAKGAENLSCPQSAGGDGGRGAVVGIELDTFGFLRRTQLRDSTRGQSSAGGAVGGQGGRASAPFFTPSEGDAGANGASPASPGAPGLAGSSGTLGGVVHTDGLWSPSGAGLDGGQGVHGVGGGGGGGGSGVPSTFVSSVARAYGGGGGGAGGCGGAGGTGGGPGGASFGLYAVDSTSDTRLTLIDCQFDASSGGAGGAGGPGGAGGLGGRGTPGTSSLSSCPLTLAEVAGGSGGNGGNGTAGGAGGGGAGGSSYGAFCSETQPLILGMFRVNAGQAGTGGSGGQQGGLGRSASEHLCR